MTGVVNFTICCFAKIYLPCGFWAYISYLLLLPEMTFQIVAVFVTTITLESAPMPIAVASVCG
ncbi:hypothetical protein ACTVNX_25415, partial [Serratia nevei]|uniref:hypothetical protein n=1 Tax=Serratia nevei TaxID=2703794 RepID=UPI003FA72C5A